MSKYIFSYPVGIRGIKHIKEKVNRFVGLDDMPVPFSLTIVKLTHNEVTDEYSQGTDIVPSEKVFNKKLDGSDVVDFYEWIVKRAKSHCGANWRHHLDAYEFFCSRNNEGKQGNYWFTAWTKKALTSGTHSFVLGRKGPNPRMEIRSKLKLEAKANAEPVFRG